MTIGSITAHPAMSILEIGAICEDVTSIVHRDVSDAIGFQGPRLKKLKTEHRAAAEARDEAAAAAASRYWLQSVVHYAGLAIAAYHGIRVENPLMRNAILGAAAAGGVAQAASDIHLSKRIAHAVASTKEAQQHIAQRIEVALLFTRILSTSGTAILIGKVGGDTTQLRNKAQLIAGLGSQALRVIQVLDDRAVSTLRARLIQVERQMFVANNQLKLSQKDLLDRVSSQADIDQQIAKFISQLSHGA